MQQRWLSAVGTSTLSRAENQAILQKVKQRGYAIAFGHAAHRQIKEAAVGWGKRDPSARTELLDRLKHFDLTYNQHPTSEDQIELRLITAPVYDIDRSLAFGLTLWGPPHPISQEELNSYVTATLESASRCTEILQQSLSTSS